jgi:A/G-specific adenine glycosylase
VSDVAVSAEIAASLQCWLEDFGRTFPFRWQRDPYRVLVAGVLLRQTRAAQVAAVFPVFIQKYGTPTLLANVDAGDLSALLTPLGITSRAKTLIDIANILMAEHKGLVPQSYDELINLPGVGDYIASCVLALSYKQPVPMVDVNVARVIRRICGANVDIHRTYAAICPKEAQEQFHYAVLDLGQLICKHSNPKCSLCPVKENCGYAHDSQR